MRTIDDLKPNEKISDISEFKYQENLTIELDKLKSDFNQGIINEIVLWKVSRYAKIEKSTLELLNIVQKNDTELNSELTSEILKKLLSTKGIRLAMASTILRFKNPNIYQIIDQRVYRYISKNNEELNEGTNIENQIKLYLDYLIRLKEVCIAHKIDFEKSDRILYLMDKEYNKGNNLKESRKNSNV
jgi:hypothetical protein